MKKHILLFLTFSLTVSGLFAQEYAKTPDPNYKPWFSYITLSGDTVVISPALATDYARITDMLLTGTLTGDSASFNYLTAASFAIGGLALDSIKLSYDAWQIYTDRLGNDQNFARLSAGNTIQFGAPVEFNSFKTYPNHNYPFMDISVNSEAAYGDEVGTGISIAGVEAFKVQALADGAGGIIEGTATVNLAVASGELYRNTANTITVSPVDNYYTVDGLTENSGFTEYVATTDSSFVIQQAGRYKVNTSHSFISSNNGMIVHCSVFVNGVESQVESERKIGTATDVGDSNGAGGLLLSRGDEVTVRVMSDGGTTVTFNHFNFVIHKVN